MTRNRICILQAVASLVLAWAAASTVAQAQTFGVLYNFGANATDPLHPLGFIAQGRDAQLYSTTASGGLNGWGAMFKFTPTGRLTVPYNFVSSTQGAAGAGLMLATDGDFYGAAGERLTSDKGNLFRITPAGTLTLLHQFTGGSDGAGPSGPPIQGRNGNFYGLTQHGGALDAGTVYKMTRTGELTTLYDFDESQGGGISLLQGTDGNFYGITYSTVFKMTPSGKLTVLYTFDGTHGAQPSSSLLQGTDGSFYGTTVAGGSSNAGVVFKITTAGKFTVIHNINGTTDGSEPSGLIQATDGNLYGVNLFGGATTQGTIFRISPQPPYLYKVIYNFDGVTAGYPGTIVQHTNGILYGDTASGGEINICDQGCGVFYELNLGLKPFVSLLSASGKVGKSVEILGQGFKGTTGVAFNGTAASFSVKSDTYLTAIVPGGATTGFLTVMTSKQELKSNKKFRVTP
jgi:uncharacterized repeat protein (TIGR03803 family)